MAEEIERGKLMTPIDMTFLFTALCEYSDVPSTPSLCFSPPTHTHSGDAAHIHSILHSHSLSVCQSAPVASRSLNFTSGTKTKIYKSRHPQRHINFPLIEKFVPTWPNTSLASSWHSLPGLASFFCCRQFVLLRAAFLVCSSVFCFCLLDVLRPLGLSGWLLILLRSLLSAFLS